MISAVNNSIGAVKNISMKGAEATAPQPAEEEAKPEAPAATLNGADALAAYNQATIKPAEDKKPEEVEQAPVEEKKAEEEPKPETAEAKEDASKVDTNAAPKEEAPAEEKKD